MNVEIEEEKNKKTKEKKVKSGGKERNETEKKGEEDGNEKREGEIGEGGGDIRRGGRRTRGRGVENLNI